MFVVMKCIWYALEHHVKGKTMPLLLASRNVRQEQDSEKHRHMQQMANKCEALLILKNIYINEYISMLIKSWNVRTHAYDMRV